MKWRLEIDTGGVGLVRGEQSMLDPTSFDYIQVASFNSIALLYY